MRQRSAVAESAKRGIELVKTGLGLQVMDLDEKDRKVTLLLGDIGGTNCRFELVDADLRTQERLKGGTLAKV
jgi:hypothetical protein